MFAKVRAKTQLWLTTGHFVLLNIGFHQLYLQADFLVDFLGYIEFSELEKDRAGRRTGIIKVVFQNVIRF